MSLDRNALLAAICARPDEDTPRLAFADWCDENVDPERAEFIRLHFTSERYAEHTPDRIDLDERAAALLAQHRAAWVARVPDWALDPEWPPEVRDFRRGFLHRVAAKAEDLLAHANDLFAATPVRKVDVRLIRDGGLALASSPALARLSEVELSFAETPIDLPAFLSSAHCSGIRDLSLGLVGPHPSGWHWTSHPMLDDVGVMALAGCANLVGLTGLTIGTGTVGARGIQSLTSSSYLSALKRLDLGYNPVDDDGLIALAGSPLSRQLTDLGLYATDISDRGLHALTDAKPRALNRLRLGGGDDFAVGDDGIRAVASCEALSNLEELDLSWWETFGSRLRIIAQSPYLANLRTLRLSSAGIDDDATLALAQSSHMRNLRCIDANNDHIGTRGCTALVRSPVFATVTVLVLYNNPEIGDAGITALAESEHAGALRRACLVKVGLGMDGLRAVFRSPHLSRLRDLDIQSTPFGDEGARLLCESPHLNRITRLAVYNCGIGKEMTAALRKRFGPALKI
jgi:uncharacterized protein (TIGR02996 family)